MSLIQKIRVMYNIRIKKSPSNKHTGDQEGFGLVRNLAAMQTTNSEVSVNDTLGAVPREKATLEAEGGESVFGDVNRDGNMELMHFVGKRHSEGGIPADIPEGSFIFSDTKSLTIKDKEVIEKLFGLPFRKQGYTPGEISRKFDINKYVQILKSDDADELTKRTAAEMLKVNKEKLGILAFIQESMKGFPDGIPTIAEEVLSKMGVNPEQLMQEAQPQPQQQGQGQEPMQPMSPEEEQMMMAMQQGQGAPMEEGMMMPEQRFGGLAKFVDGGGNNPKVQQLRKAGYNADALSNAKIQVKVPGVKMDPFIFNETDSKTQDSLVRRPVRGFEDSPLEQGKIYTFKSRPGTYYKIGPDGRLHVKNENTGWKYTVMNDPTGERRKNLEMGVESGMTKEFETQEKVLPNKYKSGNIAFSNKIEENKFKNSGAVEKVAYDVFNDALKSKDPKQMLKIANELQNDDRYNIEYSVGWLPFTNQDKISDMAAILSEEAAKIIGKKTKTELNQASVNITSKVDDIIKSFNKQYHETPLSESDKKIKLAKQIQRYKEIRNELSSGNFKGWKKLQNTDLRELPDNANDYMGLINHVNELHSNLFKSKGTVISNKDLQKKIQMDAFMRDDFEHVLPENMFDYNGAKSSGTKKDVKEVIIAGETYKLERNKDQNVVYKKVNNDIGDLEDVDPNMYPLLDEKFTQLNGKPIKGIYTSNVLDVSEVPAKELSPKEKLRQPVIQERTPITVKGRQNAPVINSEEINTESLEPQGKYSGGFTDADYNELFKQYGGEIDEYEDGGVVDSFGHMMKLPKHILKQYNPGGEIKSKGTKIKNGKTVEIFEQEFTDGSVLQIIKDDKGAIISKRLASSKEDDALGIPIRNDQNVYRGLNEKIDKIEDLSEDEKTELNTKWKGNFDEYKSYQNMRNKFLLDKDLRSEMWKQFEADRNDAELRLYTGDNLAIRTKFRDKVVEQKWDPVKKKMVKRTIGQDINAMTEDQLVQELLEQEERNRRLKLFGLKTGDQNAYGTYDPKKNKYEGLVNKQAADLIAANKDLQDLDFSRGHMSQAAYVAYQRALQKNKEKFPGYAAEQTGEDDETVFDLKGRISGVDRNSSNTTLEEFMGYTGKAEKEEKKEEKKETAEANWYCVTAEDGTKSVVQGSVAHDGTQTPPTGEDGNSGYPDKKTAEAACSVKTLDETIPQDLYDGWFMPDIVNYATAMGQRIPFTMPTLRQMQAAPSGYDLTNPIQKIAARQSAGARMSNQLFNTMDPRTAAAIMAGTEGDNLEALSGDIAATEQANINTVNQNYNTIANRAMQTDQFNTQARRQYDVDVATVIEEKARDENAKASLLAKMYGVGWGNASKDNAMRVKYPQAKFVNRLTGHYDGFGGGKGDILADTQGSTGNVSDEANAEYQRVYEARIKANDTEDVARLKADAAMKQVYNNHNYYRSNKNRNNDSYYDNQPSFSQKFGGSIYSSSPDYDFFLGQ